MFESLSADKFLAAVRKSPEGVKISAAAAAETLARRKAQAAELA